MPDTARAFDLPTAIVTHGGRVFDLADPDHTQVDITDIAVALGRIPRFAGHTRGALAYTVAQHSVLVHDLLRGTGAEAMTCYAGLLHDAHEAYMGDVTTPLKRAVPDLVLVENDLQACVARAFGLPWSLPPGPVRLIDAMAFRYEAGMLMPGTPDAWRERPAALPPTACTPAWHIEDPEDLFLTTFYEARERAEESGWPARPTLPSPGGLR